MATNNEDSKQQGVPGSAPGQKKPANQPDQENTDNPNQRQHRQSVERSMDEED